MELSKTKPNLSGFGDNVSTIEHVYNISLPADFETFLRSSNTTQWLRGVYYETNKLSQPIMFGDLLGIQDILEINADRTDELLSRAILIGSEHNDGEFYLRQIGENNYEYGFYDSNYILSEYMADENDINDDIDEKMNKKNTHFLANSFKEFLDIWYEVNE